MFRPTPVKPQGPVYTIRLLLGNIQSESKDVPSLKPFSHFTLGCTQNDEVEKIQKSFEQLADFFKTPITFKPESVVTLGSDAQPLWGVSLCLEPNEKNLRELFSNQFDSIMCPERDGNTYLWKPSLTNPQKRCAHITIGSKPEDLEIAKNLLQSKCEFVFTQMDYKKVGLHDPHVTKSFEKSSDNVMKMSFL